VPVEVRGRHSGHVFAFARRHRGRWCVVVVPRLTARLITRVRAPLGRSSWGATALVLPKGAPSRWQNLFTGKTLDPGGRAGIIYLHRVFEDFPVALLEPAGR
jgi:(1->4)-alpha-D-glucan 1-alpha-D-glucosylmutase